MMTNKVDVHPQFRVDWLGIFFAFLAIAAGLGIAFVVQRFGLLTLLLIPAGGLFLITILNPELGLITLIFVTFTQLSNVLIKFHNMPSIAQPLAGLLIVVILIRLFVFYERAEGWASAALRFAMYGVVIFLSVMTAKSFDPAFLEGQDYFKDVLVAMIIVFLVQSPLRFKRAIWAIIFAGIVMGSISTFQHIFNTFDQVYWGFGSWTTVTTGLGSVPRVAGPYGNPNPYAQVLIVVVVLAIERLWNEKTVILRILAGWSLIVSVLAIIFSYSRGGLFALAFAVAVLILTHRPKILPLLITAALAIFLIRFLPAAYTERFYALVEIFPSQSSQVNDPSIRGRMSENMASWQMFRDNPILGVGLKNYPDQYQEYSRQYGLDPRSTPRTPASLYGEILAEQGLLGILTFFYLIWTVHRGLRQARQKFKDLKKTDYALMANALWVAFAGYLFAAMMLNSSFSNVFWLIIGLSMATANVALNCCKDDKQSQETVIIKQGNLI